MSQTLAYVTPQLIRWARRRYDLTPDAAARAINVRSITAVRLRAWENDEGHPSFAQARKIAEKLHVPFGFLFLSSPPSLTIPIPDLRTVSGEPLGEPSPEFVDLTYDVLRKQQWFREYQEANDAEPVAFIGRFALGAEPKIVAADMAATLGINNDMRQGAYSWESFLRGLTRKAEAAGVLVLRSGVVGMNNFRKLRVKEFRGFAISDNLAPLVFINGQDAKSAQIFTLAHELAHLWIGTTGISNPRQDTVPGDQVNNIDRACDKIAVQLLVPEEDFKLRWEDIQDIATNADNLAEQYRVSAITVLRRALETKRITRDEFVDTYRQLVREARPPSGPGGNFLYNLRARNSTTLTATLISAAAAGQISELEAAGLLNIRVKTLSSVRDHLLDTGVLVG